MKIQITNNELKANGAMNMATLEALKVDKDIIKSVKDAMINEKEIHIKTESFEIIRDEEGLYVDIDESIFVDMSKIWCKHAPMIVAAAQNIVQAIRLFKLDWFEKVDSKFKQLQDAMRKKMKKQKPDEFEEEMLDLLFKDGVAKVTVKMKNGDEKVIRRSTDEDKLKGWDEI